MKAQTLNGMEYEGDDDHFGNNTSTQTNLYIIEDLTSFTKLLPTIKFIEVRAINEAQGNILL